MMKHNDAMERLDAAESAGRSKSGALKGMGLSKKQKSAAIRYNKKDR